MPPNLNANTIVLIYKVLNAYCMEQYIPAALANFKFKIILKILVDRLSHIMLKLISIEKRGFIKCRNIRDCLCITLKVINFLHDKA